MRLGYKLEAVKQLKKLPISEKKKIIKKLKLLSQNLYCGKSLKGELEGLRSLRAWPKNNGNSVLTLRFYSGQAFS